MLELLLYWPKMELSKFLHAFNFAHSWLVNNGPLFLDIKKVHIMAFDSHGPSMTVTIQSFAKYSLCLIWCKKISNIYSFLFRFAHWNVFSWLLLTENCPCKVKNLRKSMIQRIQFLSSPKIQWIMCSFQQMYYHHVGSSFYENHQAIPYKPSVLFMGHGQTVQIQIRHRMMRCLIRIFTVCLQNVIVKFEEKNNTTNNP